MGLGVAKGVGLDCCDAVGEVSSGVVGVGLMAGVAGVAGDFGVTDGAALVGVRLNGGSWVDVARIGMGRLGTVVKIGPSTPPNPARAAFTAAAALTMPAPQVVVVHELPAGN